jgi:hypothetical protein
MVSIPKRQEVRRRQARRLWPKDLEAPTEEGHRLAKDAMEPFLPEFQAAADEQTLLDFGVDLDAEPVRKPRRVKKTRK